MVGGVRVLYDSIPYSKHVRRVHVYDVYGCGGRTIHVYGSVRHSNLGLKMGDVYGTQFLMRTRTSVLYCIVLYGAHP